MVAVSSSLGAPVVAKGLVWVPNMADGTISAVDVALGRVERTVAIGDPKTLVSQGCGASSVHSVPHGSFDIRRCDLPSAVAYDGDSLWVTQNDRHSVLRLDPVTGRTRASIDIRIEAFGLAVGRAGVWVTDFQHGVAVHIDPATNGVAGSVTDLPPGPSDLAVGQDSIWIACARAGVVARVDAATNRVVAQVPVGKSPLPVALAFGSVWVRSEEADTLARIDPATNLVVASIDTGPPEGRDGLDQFGIDQSGLWLSGLLVRHVDAATNRIDRTEGFDAVAFDYAAGTLWAAGILGTVSRVRVS